MNNLQIGVSKRNTSHVIATKKSGQAGSEEQIAVHIDRSGTEGMSIRNRNLRVDLGVRIGEAPKIRRS
jgi:hypothetical protein